MSQRLKNDNRCKKHRYTDIGTLYPVKMEHIIIRKLQDFIKQNAPKTHQKIIENPDMIYKIKYCPKCETLKTPDGEFYFFLDYCPD